VKRGLIALAALALAAVAAVVLVLLVRGGAEAQLRTRLVSELRSRLAGEIELRSVQIAGRDTLVLEGFSWVPEHGPVGLVTVERLDLSLDTSALLDGDPRIRGGTVSGLDVVFARPEADDAAERASGRGGMGDLARALADPVPERISSAIRKLTTVVEDDAVFGLERGEVSGLALSVGDLGGEVTVGSDAVTAAILGRIGGGGGLQGSLTMRPEQLPEGVLDLTGVPVQTIAGIVGLSERPDWEGGVLDLGVRSANRDGEVRWDTTLELRELVVRLPGFKGADWPIQTSQRLSIVPSADGQRIDLADWRWSVNGVAGTGSGHLLDLAGEPEIRLVASLEQVPFWTVLQALPRDVIPTAWGIEVRGTFDLTARFSGPLRDRSRWDLGWKGDWSRLTVFSSGVGGAIAGLGEPFPYTIEQPDGTVLQRVMGPSDPHFIGLGLIHPHLQAAAVVCEDASFHVHKGFDERELREALIENLREPGEGRGGSTITQQVAKNLFLSGERTWTRKLQEAILTWSIEQSVGKARILEIYLNLAQFGPGTYGVRDAAHHYFGTSTRQLNTMECVFLATILPSPDRYHDYYHPQGAVSANWDTHMRDVLRRMHSQGYLGESEYGIAQHQLVRFVPCDRFRSDR